MKRRLRLAAIILLAAVGAVQLTRFPTLPSLEDRVASQAITATDGTRLGQAAATMVSAHPGESGMVPLRDGLDAFATRALLANAADSSLDIQYYIWRADLSGTMLAEALVRAADRGVRVRLLLDDHVTAGLDPMLSAMDAHPNIEVRLFNPYRHRGFRYLGYLTEFGRLNRRMHNKSFTADNQATIIGGRNVGDEYFGAGDAEGMLFADLDVLAIGPVVYEVSRDFDRYWASESAYPVGALLPAAKPEDVSREAAAARSRTHGVDRDEYMAAVAEQELVANLLAGTQEFDWSEISLLSDDPAKGLGRAPPESHLWPQLQAAMGRPQREMQLVSAYFVPGESGSEYLAELASSGVAVSVLTNSLEATDVAAVHAGYAKRRETMLEGGVALWEMKRDAAMPTGNGRRLGGSSSSSLHAKTVSVDRERVFVGSFNFDPRSSRLNTELGFVIPSPMLAAGVADVFTNDVPARAYRVMTDSAGDLAWHELRGDSTAVHTEEPGAGFWLRLGVGFLALLPIEWLL
ncbi:MAG TPA: phospholipase D family protein [Gemmatimonadales bacterium]|nr:phospholipase D family protein [Gemmatimonadales bacterium]